jgi:isopenicillin N synthase-like dioxygenase
MSASSANWVGLATLFGVVGATLLGQKGRTGKKSKSSAGSTLHLPVVDLQAFFQRDTNPELYAAECQKVADAMHLYGICIVKDPRVHERDNNVFIDMMERYFGLSDGKRDARPEVAFQVGVTPSLTEKPKNYCNTFGAYGPDDKPLTLCPPEKDPKWRFFWRIGPQPKETKFPSLNAAPVVPPEIPEWTDVMDNWGTKMMDALFVLAEMAAVGFKMEDTDAFTKMMQCGAHLLAPTGSDFNKFGKDGTVLAGYHYDLNFLTIHGKSRFPGLSVWSRAGQKLSVAMPDGCLLVQAGKQIEYCTGGHVLAGFHEVVCNSKTEETIAKKKEKGESLWRVSSTLFGHLQSDHILKPLAPFDTPAARAAYPDKYVGEQVSEELMAINLDQTGSTALKN